MVIEHFANVLFMFIVNVSNNFFSVLLKIFRKYFVFAGRTPLNILMSVRYGMGIQYRWLDDESAI